MIYSPAVPVFSREDGSLLPQPYPLSFITAPAVNAGAVRQNEPGKVVQIQAAMYSRMEKVLTVAFVHGHDVLILGAWGCGVFRNDPEMIARLFAQFLLPGGLFHQRFARIVFAVLDKHNEAIISPFRRWFA